MGKRRRIAFILAFIALLGGLAWFVLGRGEPEPVYKGETLSQWLQCYRQPRIAHVSAEISIPTAWKEADVAFREMGTNALPYLCRIISDHDSTLKLKGVDLIRRQSLFSVNFVPASTRREWASRAFLAIRDQARYATPELIQIYKHNPHADARSYAAWVLELVGPDAREAVPFLLHGATNLSEELSVREASIRALGNIHAEPAMVVPALIQFLADPSADLRFQAVNALGHFGADARAALPTLFDVLKHPRQNSPAMDETTRRNSAIAIQRIDPEAAAARKSEIDAALNAGKDQ